VNAGTSSLRVLMTLCECIVVVILAVFALHTNNRVLHQLIFCIGADLNIEAQQHKGIVVLYTVNCVCEHIFFYENKFCIFIFLWPPYVIGQAIYIFMLWFLLLLLFFPRVISAVGDWMSTILPHMVYISVNLECRSQTCCARLAENTAHKKSPKNRHLGTIPQLRRAISSQLRHVSTIGKKTC